MPRISADGRLQRLLAIVPWVAAHDGPTVQEICARFGVTEEELLADLDQLWLCGLYPYTPDVLVDVDIADGRVWIRYADFFRRPLRLTAAEGLALLSAGTALLSMPGQEGNSALARAIGKLASVLGVQGDDTVEVELAPVAADVLRVAQEGTADCRSIEIDYYSFGRDEHTVRQVDPWEVFNAGGHWYLDGWCHRAGGRRLFRIDRVQRAALTDARFQRPSPSASGQPALYSPRPGDPAVTIDLAPAARWVAELYPTEAVEVLPDGRLRVTLRVSGEAWLQRLLLRLGPQATMVEGDGGPATDAAVRILARYRRSGTNARDQGSTLASS